MTDTDALVERLKAAQRRWPDGYAAGLLGAAADIIPALKAERDVWKASYTTACKAADMLANEQAARIAALEADIAKAVTMMEGAADALDQKDARIAALEANRDLICVNCGRVGPPPPPPFLSCCPERKTQPVRERIEALEAENATLRNRREQERQDAYHSAIVGGVL